MGCTIEQIILLLIGSSLVITRLKVTCGVQFPLITRDDPIINVTLIGIQRFQFRSMADLKSIEWNPTVPITINGS